jgi:hypothetical protein
MKNMKRNVLLIPFVAVMTLLVVAFASADLADDMYTKFNGVTLSDGSTMVGNVGDVVPLRVTFTANESANDVRIKVYMEGHRDDVSVRSDRFDIESGVTYTKLLSLHLPSDSDDLSETYTLYVEVVTKNGRSEEVYTVSMQRESYTLEVLSVDYSSRVEAGEVFPVSVVVKNTGYNRMDDTYVVVSIPALGVSTRGYLGDLVSTDEDEDYEDKEDSMSKTVALMIPADVATGVYEMEVVVYNDDARTTTGSLIAVDGVDDDDSDSNDDVLDGEDNSSTSTAVVALTVILVIVFVVLLAVLVILLTKKGKTVEEVETSYY